MQLQFKKLHKHAIAPVYATPGAACFDLHAFLDNDGGAVVGRYHLKDKSTC